MEDELLVLAVLVESVPADEVPELEWLPVDDPEAEPRTVVPHSDDVAEEPEELPDGEPEVPEEPLLDVVPLLEVMAAVEVLLAEVVLALTDDVP